MNDTTAPVRALPYSHCSVCRKTIEEIGGRRLTGSRQPLTEETMRHINDDIIPTGLKPWFCQKCTHMVCRRCGEPWTNPMSYDVSENRILIHTQIFLNIQPHCCKSMWFHSISIHSCLFTTIPQPRYNGKIFTPSKASSAFDKEILAT